MGLKPFTFSLGLLDLIHQNAPPPPQFPMKENTEPLTIAGIHLGVRPVCLGLRLKTGAKMGRLGGSGG